MIARTLQFRLIPTLTFIAGSLLAAYVALIVATIMFAAVQTTLASDVQQERQEIAKLERKYYDSIARMDATDPYSLGYVTPHTVQYVTAAAKNLTFAR